MFTFDRGRVVAICKKLMETGLRLQWSCSARPDSVDAELLRLMYRAGCTDIYFGLETGSPRIQKLINKRLNIGESLSTFKIALQIGMKVTVAFIIGFPQETEDDLTSTLTTALRIGSWPSERVSIQVHLLSPLAGTQLTEKYAGEILYDGHSPSLASVNCLTTWEEHQIRTRRDLFSSFYYFRNPHISRSTFKWLHTALATGARASLLNSLYHRYGESAGAVLLQWARQRGHYPIGSVVQRRWTEMRRQWAH